MRNDIYVFIYVTSTNLVDIEFRWIFKLTVTRDIGQDKRLR